MDVLVGPFVRQEDLATLRIDIRERVKDMAVTKRYYTHAVHTDTGTYVRSSAGIKEGGNLRPYMPQFTKLIVKR